MGAKRAGELTPRQREWLVHLRRARSAGESVRAYAKQQGLSEHALYQAAKDLRRKGVLAPSRRRTKGLAGSRATARFVEVRATGPAASEASSAWRARLPNGVVVEGAGDLDGVLAVLARL